MSALRSALVAAVLVSASLAAAAQTPATLDPVAAQRVAALESEVMRLRTELARLRAQSGTAAPDWGDAHVRLPRPPAATRSWRTPGPGEAPPLSPLQAQWAWVQPTMPGLVAPFWWAGAYCPPCPACDGFAQTRLR
jgi:hypothetical protein